MDSRQESVLTKHIPQLARSLVKTRDMNRCTRCLTPTDGEWHHRRSRAVVDEHQHCACNGILLCHTCHRWIHANPFDARHHGWIVSRHQLPFEQPIRTSQYGWVLLTCEAFYHSTPNPHEEEP